MQLVDPSVSRAKLGRELDTWRQNEQEYRRKGWILLKADLDALVVEVAFLALLPLGNTQVPLVVPAIRLSYDNYDLWPPSLTFIDVFSGSPMRPPLSVAVGDGGRNILIDRDGKPFLCLKGVREYHEHPDHDGDRWELYRSAGFGTLAVVCDRVHTSMTSLVAGVGFQMQVAIASVGPNVSPEDARQSAAQIRAQYDTNVATHAAAIERR